MQSGSTGFPMWSFKSKQHSPVVLSVMYAAQDCYHFKSVDEKQVVWISMNWLFKWMLSSTISL